MFIFLFVINIQGDSNFIIQTFHHILNIQYRENSIDQYICKWYMVKQILGE